MPSGEPSSTIISSQSRLLLRGVALARSCLGFNGNVKGVDGLSCESSLEEPADYGEVAALIVGGEDHGVFFFGRHA